MSKMKKFANELDGFGGLFDDPCLELFDEHPLKKKKKKKKKGSDDTSGMSKRERNAEEAYIESLASLSKKELRRKLERFGGVVDPDAGKKALVKEIVRLRRAAIGRDQKAVTLKTSGSMESVGMKLVNSTAELTEIPPFYFDEESRAFVINKADEAPDADVYAAMRGLGALRRSVRPDDGFADLMERIHESVTSAIRENAKRIGDKELIKEIIDVDFEVVDEQPAKKELPMAGLVEAPQSQPAEEQMDDKALSELSASLDNALSALNASTQATEAVKEKLPKKKSGKK